MADGNARTSVRNSLDGLQWGWRRRLPVTLQTEAAECGLACLAMIASYHGHEVDLPGLRRRFCTSLKGANLLRIMDMATQLDFVTQPLRLELDELDQLKTPCILHWDLNHFVVLKRVTPRQAIDIRKIGSEAYRRAIGAVMQDDQLFAGSIADNISFFDPEATQARIEVAACMAAIHQDITAMPMGYQSLVGDMGSSLSGGQKQRVILARALYRKPKLLVLDEATSHLDMEREREVNAAVRQLDLTRIVIAHRPQTVASADRVISIVNGAST